MVKKLEVIGQPDLLDVDPKNYCHLVAITVPWIVNHPEEAGVLTHFGEGAQIEMNLREE